MLIIDFQDKESTLGNLWVLGDSFSGRGRKLKCTDVWFIFGAESLPGQMSVRKDQPLFPAAVHRHPLCFNESELKYKCQAISSLYQEGWEKWGVEWCFHMVMVCSRAAQVHFKGGGNEKEMTQSCGRMSSKHISMDSSSEHCRFGRASHTSSLSSREGSCCAWLLHRALAAAAASDLRLFFWGGLTLV